MERVRTPSQDHDEFDRICSQIAEFETLPAHTPEPSSVQEDPQDTELDGLILAGLVSPV
jgi:hypothetical protein